MDTDRPYRLDGSHLPALRQVSHQGALHVERAFGHVAKKCRLCRCLRTFLSQYSANESHERHCLSHSARFSGWSQTAPSMADAINRPPKKLTSHSSGTNPTGDSLNRCVAGSRRLPCASMPRVSRSCSSPALMRRCLAISASVCSMAWSTVVEDVGDGGLF